MQNRVVGVDLVIDVDVGIDADIDRDVDAGRNDEIGRDVDVYLCSVAEEEKLRLQLARSLIPGFHKINDNQGCISCGTCSYPELTKDHVLTSAYVKIFRNVT